MTRKDSMFDELRSTNSVPIEPQGAPLQGVSMSMTDLERDNMRMKNASAWGGFENWSCEAFSLDNSPGAGTISPSRILGDRSDDKGEINCPYPGRC